jgi:acyl-CoA thioester hydrolase
MISPGAFEHRMTASHNDIDHMGHVNNVVYVKWVQEVAWAHWQFAATEFLRSKYSWVLLRHEIDYRHAAFSGDQIAGYTWVGKSDGPKFERFVTLCRVADGKVLVESKTLWCLLETKSMRPKRIGEDITSILQIGTAKS